MDNANPPPTRPVLPIALRARFNQELQKLQKIPAFVDSRLENIERFLNRFTNQPNETSINDPEFDNGSVDTPLVSSFPHSDNDSEDEGVLNELSAYENAGALHRERIINSFDEDDLAFEYFVVLEDIGEFITSDMADVLMGRPFRKTTKLKYDVAKGLVSFTKIFDTYAYRITHTIPRLKNFNWSKVPPLFIFDGEELGSSREFHLDDSRRTI
ncbi:hypothetical protein Tco_1076801 [Tanacetum coccineum]